MKNPFSMMKRGVLYAFCYIFTPLFISSCDSDEARTPNTIATQDSVIESVSDTVRHEVYNFNLTEVPVVVSNRRDAFVGNLVNLKQSEACHLSPLNPLTNVKLSFMITFNSDFAAEDNVPSLDVTNRLGKILKDSANTSVLFSSGSNTYSSLREMRLHSRGEWAIALDSLCLKNQTSLNKKNITVYTTRQIFGYLSVDYFDKKLLPHDITGKPNVGYINNLAYGKLSYVVVANATDNIKQLINRYINGETLSADEQYQIKDVEIFSVTFDELCRPQVERIDKTYPTDFAELFVKQPIRPISFEVFSLGDDGRTTLRSSVNMK